MSTIFPITAKQVLQEVKANVVGCVGLDAYIRVGVESAFSQQNSVGEWGTL